MTEETAFQGLPPARSAGGQIRPRPAPRPRLPARALAAIVVSLVSIVPSHAVTPLSSGDRLDVVRRQIEKLRFDRAMQECDRILEADPGNLEAWKLRGEVALMQADLDEALDSWRIASDLAPDDMELLVKIGDLLIRRADRLGEALDFYGRALLADPGHTRVLVSMGSIYERQLRWDQAAAAYRAALVVDPNLLRARGSLGAVLFKTGDYSGAGSELRKAIELSPSDLRSHVFFGLSQNHLGNYDLALTELKKGVELDPHSANQLIGVREQRDQFMHLIGVFAQAYEESPLEAGRSYDLAVIHYFAHDYDNAWKHLLRAERLRYPIPMTFKEVVYSKRRLEQGSR